MARINTLLSLPSLDTFQLILIMVSGGKDSTDCIIELIRQGADPARIRLWHQAIDGREETCQAFFDWECVPGYVTALADHFAIPLDWQWRAGGFKTELYKEQARSADIFARFSDGTRWHLPTTERATVSTRRKFPAKSGSLLTRWCTGCLKIDVSRRVINRLKHQLPKGSRILVVTGERREESPRRAKMVNVAKHECWSRDYEVYHWRPVLEWKEKRVWEVMAANQILPCPPYYLGFPRLSCRSCIYYNNDHFATLADVDPTTIAMLREVEIDLDFTIDHRLTVAEMARQGTSLCTEEGRQYVQQALTPWEGNISTQGKPWVLPAGAYGEGGGSS